MAQAADRFSPHMPKVAAILLGKPNLALSSKDELRFGNNGSVSVDLKKGAAFDHSDDQGGGVLWLIERHTGRAGHSAVEWMEEHGLHVEDERAPRGNGHAMSYDERPVEPAPPPPRDRSDDAAQAEMRAARRRPPTAIYDYVDETGHLLFQACRYEWEFDGKRHKTFSQRRRARDGDEPEKVRNGWVQSIKGERIVPYRFRELISDRDAASTIFLCEGEKDVDNLRTLGAPATCNPMGAGKWWPELTEALRGADVVILPDNDEPGRSHAQRVAGEIHSVARDVRILALPGLGEKGDVSDWIGAGGGIDELYALAERFGRPYEDSPRPREARFGRITFGELRTRKAKAPDFIIDEWMIAREQSMLAGESQSGKSFLAIHAALSIATGMDVFGRRVVPGLVIYQAGESGTGVMDLRIPAWTQHFGAAIPEHVPFEILPAKVDLWSDQGNAKDFIDTVKAIAAEHAPLPLRAVFIDTLSKAMAGANENDGRDVSRVLANAELISRETGAHVCIVHHFPKGGKTLRGHGSLKADVDVVALVNMDEQTKVRTITFDKVKDGERGGKLQFELMQVRLGERDDGKPITSCVVLPVGEKQAARAEIANSVRLTTIEMTMFQALWKALADHGSPPPLSLDCSPNTKVVAYDEVKRLYVEACPDDEVEPGSDDQAREDARRRHLDRLRKQMKAAAQKMATAWKVLSIGKCANPDTGKETYYAWWTGRPVRGMPATYPPKPKEDKAPAALSEGGDWTKDIL